MARILVIDDAPNYLALCRSMLEEAGHQVDVAGDGFQGIHRFHRRPADLVVCDLLMPEQDGCQTICALRAVSTVPIVVMSGRHSFYPGAKSCDDALALGANRILRKPFTGRELLALVDELLQSPAQSA